MISKTLFCVLKYNAMNICITSIRKPYRVIKISDNDLGGKVAEITNFRYIFVAEKIGEDQK